MIMVDFLKRADQPVSLVDLKRVVCPYFDETWRLSIGSDRLLRHGLDFTQAISMGFEVERAHVLLEADNLGDVMTMRQKFSGCQRLTWRKYFHFFYEVLKEALPHSNGKSAILLPIVWEYIFEKSGSNSNTYQAFKGRLDYHAKYPLTAEELETSFDLEKNGLTIDTSTKYHSSKRDTTVFRIDIL